MMWTFWNSRTGQKLPPVEATWEEVKYLFVQHASSHRRIDWILVEGNPESMPELCSGRAYFPSGRLSLTKRIHAATAVIE